MYFLLFCFVCCIVLWSTYGKSTRSHPTISLESPKKHVRRSCAMYRVPLILLTFLLAYRCATAKGCGTCASLCIVCVATFFWNTHHKIHGHSPVDILAYQVYLRIVSRHEDIVHRRCQSTVAVSKIWCLCSVSCALLFVGSRTGRRTRSQQALRPTTAQQLFVLNKSFTYLHIDLRISCIPATGAYLWFNLHTRAVSIWRYCVSTHTVATFLYVRCATFCGTRTAGSTRSLHAHFVH